MDWKTAMRQRAISARQALARHGWAIGDWEMGADGHMFPPHRGRA